MSYTQNRARKEHPHHFPVNAKQKNGNYGQRGARHRNAQETAIEIHQCAPAAKIPYPPDFIHDHDGKCRRKPP